MKQSEKDSLNKVLTDKIQKYQEELRSMPGTEDFRIKRFYVYGIIHSCNSMLSQLKKH